MGDFLGKPENDFLKFRGQNREKVCFLPVLMSLELDRLVLIELNLFVNC